MQLPVPGPSTPALSERSHLRRPQLHAALIAALLIGHTVIHYMALFPPVREPAEHIPFLTFHVLHEAEYLGVIAYAAWAFRLRGGAIAWAATAVASLPFIFAGRIYGPEHLEYGFTGPGNALLEVAVILVVGGFIVLLNELWARERDQRQAALEALENALDQLKAAQASLVKQERLSALGTMATGVAHDFNNLLTPILGYSQLLLETADQHRNPDAAREQLGAIVLAAEDAKQLVHRLRAFSRPRTEHKAAPVDLNAIVQQTIGLSNARRMHAEARCKSAITVTVEGPLLPVITGDEAELREALTNLLYNAFDALPKGGAVRLRTRTEDDHVLLEVEDTGTGMPPEVLARCLEPLFTTKGDEGTGLGLSMVHGIMQRHGGSIGIDSEVGRGTTFTLRLPLNRAASVPAWVARASS